MDVSVSGMKSPASGAAAGSFCSVDQGLIATLAELITILDEPHFPQTLAGLIEAATGYESAVFVGYSRARVLSQSSATCPPTTSAVPWIRISKAPTFWTRGTT